MVHFEDHLLSERGAQVQRQQRSAEQGEQLMRFHSSSVSDAFYWSATARALAELGLEDNVRSAIPHFMVLPRILAETDLAVIMPAPLSEAFAQMGQYTVWTRHVGLPVFDVSIHWYWRFEGEPGNRWLRELIRSLFCEGEAIPAGRHPHQIARGVTAGDQAIGERRGLRL
jgi:hypothetical protein